MEILELKNTIINKNFSFLFQGLNRRFGLAEEKIIEFKTV